MTRHRGRPSPPDRTTYRVSPSRQPLRQCVPLRGCPRDARPRCGLRAREERGRGHRQATGGAAATLLARRRAQGTEVWSRPSLASVGCDEIPLVCPKRDGSIGGVSPIPQPNRRRAFQKTVGALSAPPGRFANGLHFHVSRDDRPRRRKVVRNRGAVVSHLRSSVGSGLAGLRSRQRASTVSIVGCAQNPLGVMGTSRRWSMILI